MCIFHDSIEIRALKIVLQLESKLIPTGSSLNPWFLVAGTILGYSRTLAGGGQLE